MNIIFLGGICPKVDPRFGPAAAARERAGRSGAAGRGGTNVETNTIGCNNGLFRIYRNVIIGRVNFLIIYLPKIQINGMFNISPNCLKFILFRANTSILIKSNIFYIVTIGAKTIRRHTPTVPFSQDCNNWKRFFT